MRSVIAAVLIFILAGLSFMYFDLPLALMKRTVYMNDIELCSNKYRIDPLLIAAMVKAESNFSHTARSHRGAVGLMQLMPSTARDIARELGYRHFRAEDLEDPRINIRLGTHYFNRLMRDFNQNEILALAAYNAGRTKVQGWYRKDPRRGNDISTLPYRETRNYVTRVQRTYKWLKKIQELRRFMRRKTA